MAVGLIENPLEAFSSAGQDTAQQLASLEIYLPAATTLAAGVIVIPTISGTEVQATLGTAGTYAQAIGITRKAALATGALVPVVIHGPVFAAAVTAATIAAGLGFSAGAAGLGVAAVATVGGNIGLCVAEAVTTGPWQAFVCKY